MDLLGIFGGTLGHSIRVLILAVQDGGHHTNQFTCQSGPPESFSPNSCAPLFCVNGSACLEHWIGEGVESRLRLVLSTACHATTSYSVVS